MSYGDESPLENHNISFCISVENIRRNKLPTHSFNIASIILPENIYNCLCLTEFVMVGKEK